MEKTYRARVMVFPFHGQGHINPMVQFAKRLASKGVKVTIATTLSNTKTMQVGDGSIKFEPIYDDCTEGGLGGQGGFKGYLERFEASGSRNIAELIGKLENSEYPVKCLVYDANILWALDIAKRLGIAGAAFFTQSCAAIACYYPMYYELLGEPLPLPALSIPALPEFRIPNLPSLGSVTERYPPIIRHILNQFNNIDKADWVLFNSFHKLEEEVVKWMSNLWSVGLVGPTVPSVYLDKRVDNDNDYGFNLYEPNADACMKWLDTKGTGSVVYVSFGSAANLNEDQIAEMAAALRQNDDDNSNSFLWVVKPTEESKLPSNFANEMLGKGLVVTWCPQLEVLTHHAVGCFVTHAGWNSTMEAISFGVPMVAMPQFLDQITNAHFVEHVWEVGVKPKVDEKGLATREEIQRCIREILHGERGEEIKKNAIKWKGLAKEAVCENGSSDKYIDEIIARLVPT
ncbi:UDP-glycosyltransferase 74G1-like [Cornus florida]|uniref:UDP-glycosyltransferase 74G1-like n=1 Tax=Cornus florida TaxID=4283 RepID=UPI00289A34DB|nr:UDP-glycosyltransferase 74G1-like [Cornus florida]XP_059636421.1 UDP-glycosyltransferase 74G1-like [Cornus florida]